MSALAGQVAWVTGGGSGIGLAGALALAGHGATVVVSGRDAAKLDAAIAAAPAGLTGRLHAAPLDVADGAAVRRVAVGLAERFGGVDILVNSAGLNVRNRHWDDTDGDSFEHVVAINLSGATHCTLAVLPGMRSRRRGTVVNVASFAGWQVGRLTGPAYTASKAGLIALTHSFNVEEAVHGLRATALCPGEVATPILKTRPVEPSEAEKARMLQEEDLGRTIAFIATMPPHVCINELVISPVHNRLYVGGGELGAQP